MVYYTERQLLRRAYYYSQNLLDNISHSRAVSVRRLLLMGARASCSEIIRARELLFPRELICKLVESCPNPSISVAYLARDGYARALELALELNEFNSVSMYALETAFSWAAESGHIECLRILMRHGVNVSAHGEYALRWAVLRGHEDVVLFLLEHGANPWKAGAWLTARNYDRHARLLYQLHLNKGCANLPAGRFISL